MNLEDLIIIDWHSPPAHENFNCSLVHALAGRFKRFYVFERYETIDAKFMVFLDRPQTRMQYARTILNLIRDEHPHSPILLLSYDSLLIPLFVKYSRNLLVFEHNTTPEIGAFKHAIWQLVLTRWVRRLAQFPQQSERLALLKQNVMFVGSPLVVLRPNKKSKVSPTPVFLIPSARSDQSTLFPYLHLFKGSTLACKCASKEFIDLARQADVSVIIHKRLEFCNNEALVSGVIISVPSSIRGSGWVNDAIGFEVPIISVTQTTTNLIQSTFPQIKLIHLMNIRSQADFETALKCARKQKFEDLIETNNKLLLSRLEQEVSNMQA